MYHQECPYRYLQGVTSAWHAQDALNYPSMPSDKNIHIFIEYAGLKKILYFNFLISLAGAESANKILKNPENNPLDHNTPAKQVEDKPP